MEDTPWLKWHVLFNTKTHVKDRGLPYHLTSNVVLWEHKCIHISGTSEKGHTQISWSPSLDPLHHRDWTTMAGLIVISGSWRRRAGSSRADTFIYWRKEYFKAWEESQPVQMYVFLKLQVLWCPSRRRQTDTESNKHFNIDWHFFQKRFSLCHELSFSSNPTYLTKMKKSFQIVCSFLITKWCQWWACLRSNMRHVMCDEIKEKSR